MTTSLTFYARGDSNTAGNASLNALGTNGRNGVPTTELIFSSGANGDILLDYANGGFDPDTTVFVDGVERQFVVEFSGNLPSTNKLSNVNGENLQGEEIIVITTDDGTRYFFLTNGTTSEATMDDFPNGAHPIENVDNTNTGIICFARGSYISTMRGDVKVEDLTLQDQLITADGGAAPIRWMTSSRFGFADLLKAPHLRPVCIPKGFLADNMPDRDLVVSPLHRVAVSSWVAEMYFFDSEVMVRADHLMHGQSVPNVDISKGVEYFHNLLDQHEVVYANGLSTESFYPGEVAIDSMSDAARTDLSTLSGRTSTDWTGYGPTARLSLARFETELLIKHAGVSALYSIGAAHMDQRIAA